MTTEEILQQCKVDGLVIKLPAILLDRKAYIDVAKKLELIGGKWKGGKIAGFVFNEDPTDLLAEIATGAKRNLKKEFQFFGTPAKLADRLVEYAEIEQHHSVLEPSAGQGAIVKAIGRRFPAMEVDCFELMPLNQSFLNKLPTAHLIGEDFLTATGPRYERIVANPPFSKNQDIDHIYHMANQFLKFGGRLVSIAGKHWQISSNKKEVQFWEWLNEINAVIIDLPVGEFKESGTTIATCIIIIDL